MPAQTPHLRALPPPLAGAFPPGAAAASAAELAEIGYGLVALHPGGAEHLANIDAEILRTDLEVRRAATIRRRTDAVLDPLFFWPLCAAICQFTMHLLS